MEKSEIVIACAQMDPIFGDKKNNIEKSISLINRASDQKAKIIVLPELCNTGYMFKHRKEAFSMAEPLNGITIQKWIEVASDLDVIVVAGFAEKVANKLYNSAVLLDKTGIIGHYRKMHLWYEEKLFFEPGNLSIPVFDTVYGKIACAICYDMWFPETFRLASLGGADLLCVPTNWVPMDSQPDDFMVMANILGMAGAHSNSIFVAAADRVGIERNQAFLGNSIIISQTGFPIAGPASLDKEEIITATINLSDARKGRQLNTLNNVHHDRRYHVL